MQMQGKRRRGRPKKRWLDNIRDYTKEHSMTEEMAQNLIMCGTSKAGPHKHVDMCMWKSYEKQNTNPHLQYLRQYTYLALLNMLFAIINFVYPNRFNYAIDILID